MRIILVEKCRLNASSLAYFLEMNNFEVSIACNLKEALNYLTQQHVHLMLLGRSWQQQLHLPTSEDLTTINKLISSCDIISVVPQHEEHHMPDTCYLNVSGLIYEHDSVEVILDCVRNIKLNGRYISEALWCYLTKGSNLPCNKLTSRELEVARLIIKGFNGHKIANKLFLSEETIKVHRKNIRSKLGINGRKTEFINALNLYNYLYKFSETDNGPATGVRSRRN